MEASAAYDDECPIDLRPMVPADHAYVFNSMLRTVRSCGSCRGMQTSAFYGTYHDVVEGLLRSPDVAAIVACDPDDRDYICGYALLGMVGGVPVVHYAHVRGTMRGMGVFARMMATAGIGKDDPVAYGFDTNDARRIARRSYPKAVHRHDVTLAAARGAL